MGESDWGKRLRAKANQNTSKANTNKKPEFGIEGTKNVRNQNTKGIARYTKDNNENDEK